MSDKTNSEALTLRALIQTILESHPYTSIMQLLTNALAYDPDNKRARLLMKQVKSRESVKKEGNAAFSAEDWQGAVDIYSRLIEEDEWSGMMKVKLFSNRAIVYSKVWEWEGGGDREWG